MFKKWNKMKASQSDNSNDNSSISMPIFPTIEKNIEFLQDTFSNSEDMVFKKIETKQLTAVLVYIQELSSESGLEVIERGIYELSSGQAKVDSKNIIDALNQRFSISEIKEVKQFKEIIDGILVGQSALMIEKSSQVFLFNTSNSVGRSITEPSTEQVVRGSRDGFVELLNTNLLLIRRRIKNPCLKIEYFAVGKQSQTKIAIVYLDKLVDPNLVKEVHDRLNRINIDAVLESNYIEQLIQDAPYSPFPTVYNTERPDRVAAAILEGKVGILTDGSPFALTVPAVFVEFLHANEDYYDASIPATIIRWMRALGLLITSFLTASFVAVTTMHQDLLQTPFLIRIAGYREDLPYPVLVEAFFMQLTFELVREAGLRMPKAIGSAVSIVGTLVIGQAAVQAGLVGAVMVIVVAVTALTTFVIPNYNFMQVARYSGFPMLLLAGLFGFMGIIVGLMFILAHIVSLRSFGVPYLSPITPAHKEGWKDVFYRAPWTKMKTRNPGMGVENLTRNQTPTPSPDLPSTPEGK